MRSQRWFSPRRQNQQVPQYSSGITEMRSPTTTLVTCAPTASTSADSSWPRICGSSAPVSGCGAAGVTIGPARYSCRSVPQIPHHRGRIRTWVAPSSPSGSGTCSTRMSLAP